jgi:hypothetical protein
MGSECFHFVTIFRPALQSTHPPVQWVIEAASIVVNQNKTGLSSLSCAGGNFTSTPTYIFMT